MGVEKEGTLLWENTVGLWEDRGSSCLTSEIEEGFLQGQVTPDLEEGRTSQKKEDRESLIEEEAGAKP